MRLMYYTMLSLHLLGATIWAGGHLVLALTILPRALRQRQASIVSDFEASFERVGLPALGTQIVTGLWLAYHLLGSPDHWFQANSVARVVQIKLGLLALTLALALHARLRVISPTRRRNPAEVGLAHPSRHPGRGGLCARRSQHPLRWVPGLPPMSGCGAPPRS